MRVCSLRYPSCNVHAACCKVIRDMPGSTIPPPKHYLINVTICMKRKSVGLKLCSDFMYKFLYEIFFILRRLQRETINLLATDFFFFKF